MAEAFVTLLASKFGYTKSDQADTHFAVSTSSSYLLTGYAERKYFYIGFSAMPSSLKRKKLLGCQMCIRFKIGASAPLIYALEEDFNADTITYNTAPDRGLGLAAPNYSDYGDYNWHDAVFPTGSTVYRDYAAAAILACNGIELTDTSATTSENYKWYIMPSLSGGSSPYVKILYDDAVNVTSKVTATSYPSGSSVRANSAQTFQWKLEKDGSNYCASEVWTQASAKLYWKKSTDSSWTVRNISGSSMSTTVPAGTFPSGSTIQWYIQCTDTDGTTTSTTQKSFTTLSSAITPSAYPSGSNIDSRGALSFSWTFSNGYTQQSASLRWKESSESSWHSLSASGTTQSLSVAGYTFPTGATIQWYLRGVDNYGTVSTSSVQEFVTASASVVPATFPSGSGIFTPSALTFTWDITGDAGSYDQQSAILYWKKSNDSNYTAINISGSTKSVSVPANTFPSGSTVQWYLEATDASGTASQSSVRNFSTQSPSLTPVTYPSGSSVNFGESQLFTWTLSSASGDFTQQSAKLYWRSSTEESWTAITVSGNVKSLTVPASTFPAGKTITWYLEATDVGGTTVTASQRSFATSSSTLTPTVYPSGSGVDSRSAITFRWTFPSGFSQQSAALKWKTASASVWNTISAPGSTMEVTVSGYTFPTGASIQWYLSGTDNYGTALTSDTRTFSTADADVVPDSYPSGSGVFSPEALTFTWDISGSAGSYTQRSAILYWKKSTASSYTAINVSGGTKSVTVPANTFPSGSTVQWYIRATDASGTVHESSGRNFSTQSPTVTPATYPSGSSVNFGESQLFTWTLATASGDFSQQSAKLYWRSGTEESWNRITVSGGTKSLTVGASTFPSDKTIYWYLEATDVGGTTVTSGQYSFKTTSSSITPTAYPSGNNVDSRAALEFQWAFPSGFSQQSAALKWKTSLESSWHSISAPGSTMKVTVAGYTFPTGATIQWYLNGTDNYGTTTNSDVSSFTTADATVTPDSYPSGSGTDTRQALSFTWDISGTLGSYTQRAAVFYWKKSTEADYRAVSVSGNTKSVTIAANTFPTSSTIQWYLRATDASGVVTECSPRSFSTQSPTIVPSTYPSGTGVNFGEPIFFSWSLRTSSGEFTQQSAALYWRASTSESWSVVQASGSTKSLTVPAYTFPPDKTITWYLEGTDVGGTTSTSSQMTFKTEASGIIPTVYPSGNSVDSRSTTTFQWEFPSGFTQRSATLYWKTTAESDWHSVAASGTAMSITMAGYAFPTGSVIQWYLEGTDNYGTTSTSTEQRFTTASASVDLKIYPSGSNIYTGQAISFTWDITGTLGSYNQRSAVFYWKVSTLDSYTAVSVSGNVKRATIPGDTFPTSSTIQWYVRATDASGVTTESSVRSFGTQSTGIVPLTYPSGNGINFGEPIYFSWSIRTASGEYAQQSATFYWRTSTQENWAAIPASGGTKELYVPAYTFPSNKTIYWYLEGTDIGGATSTSSQMSFVTASPVITPQDSPTSGYADPRLAITFSWYFTDGISAYDQRSAALKWRVSGATVWNTITASGTEGSVTVAANTFPTQSIIEWMLTGIDRGGTTSETDVFSFSTTASTAYAICNYPVGRTEDGSKEITFRWSVRNADGTLPSRIVVKWKKSSETASSWRTLLDAQEPQMSVTVPADTFPAGGIDWQVVAYNRDDVAGPASLASFVCVTAPDAPSGLTATAAPRTVISWQASGQEAYEVEIDGETVKTGYGPSVMLYLQEEPLPDGVHLIRVRIQGEAGRWSNWAETTVSITNVPKGSLSLRGRFRIDGDLSWTYTGAAEPEVIAIYRDGVWIGRATGKTAFRDRVVLGKHTYRVEYWFPDGNYTRSNDLSGSMESEMLRIAALDGGEWMGLRLSTVSERQQTFNWSQRQAFHNVTGSKWPVLETAPYETLSVRYECAFKDPKCAAQFEQLRGRMVILKSKGGNVLIGGLTNMGKTVTEFYIAFEFAVSQNQWEDFINDDQND